MGTQQKMDPELQYRSAAVNATACVREGWETIKPNYLLFLGMVVVQLLVVFLATLVPFIGAVLGNMISAALVCGIFIAILAAFRGEQLSIAMMFEGFSRFVPVAVIMIIETIPFVIVAAVLVSSGMLPEAPANNVNPEITAEQLQELVQNIGAPLVISYAAAFLVSMALKALLFFAVPLIADRNVGAVEAISMSFRAARRNLGGIVLVMLLQFAIIVAGLLVFCIGIILVIPLYHAVEVAAYRQVFGKEAIESGPPAPDQYDIDEA